MMLDSYCPQEDQQQPCLAMRIHVSWATNDLLQDVGKYEMSERGVIVVKGKGNCMTYWLVAKKAPGTSNGNIFDVLVEV